MGVISFLSYVTTLRALREHNACASRYRFLAKALNARIARRAVEGALVYGGEAPIPVTKILATNGLDDAIWALRTLPDNEQGQVRLFACRCVRETPLADRRTVWDLLSDERSRSAVETAERYGRGEATDEQLAAARAAAWDAVVTAAEAAGAAAWAAARAAAWASATGADVARAAAEAAGAAGAAGSAAAAWAARDVQEQIFREMFS